MERLFSLGRERDEKLKKLQEKWENVSQLVSSTTKKELNNRYVFDKLKKDFANFFNKEVFYTQQEHVNNMDGSITAVNKSQNFIERSPLSVCKTTGVFSPKLSGLDGLDQMTLIQGKNATEQLKKGTPIKLKNYIKLMHVLGFISVKNKSTSEEEMLTEAWKIFKGNIGNHVKTKNLFVLLCGVMNIQLPDIVQKHAEQVDSQQSETPAGHTRSTKYLCHDEYHNLHFTSYEDITKIHHRFMQFSVNRKSKKRDDSKSSAKDSSTERAPFTPSIGSKSKLLADSKLKQTLSP